MDLQMDGRTIGNYKIIRLDIKVLFTELIYAIPINYVIKSKNHVKYCRNSINLSSSNEISNLISITLSKQTIEHLQV